MQKKTSTVKGKMVKKLIIRQGLFLLIYLKLVLLSSSLLFPKCNGVQSWSVSSKSYSNICWNYWPIRHRLPLPLGESRWIIFYQLWALHIANEIFCITELLTEHSQFTVVVSFPDFTFKDPSVHWLLFQYYFFSFNLFHLFSKHNFKETRTSSVWMLFSSLCFLFALMPNTDCRYRWI